MNTRNFFLLLSFTFFARKKNGKFYFYCLLNANSLFSLKKNEKLLFNRMVELEREPIRLELKFEFSRRLIKNKKNSFDFVEFAFICLQCVIDNFNYKHCHDIFNEAPFFLGKLENWKKENNAYEWEECFSTLTVYLCSQLHTHNNKCQAQIRISCLLYFSINFPAFGNFCFQHLLIPIITHNLWSAVPF